MIMTQQNIEWSPQVWALLLLLGKIWKRESESSLRPRRWRRSAGQAALFNSSEVGHHGCWRDLACHSGESPLETQT